MPANIKDQSSLITLISKEQPCGPDLDENEDEAYVAFMSTIEVILPEDYLVDDQTGKMVPFHNHDDFKDLDLSAWIATGRSLCGRTHDLRLLFVVAKLCILNRSISAFQSVVDTIATLLDTAWEDVHPRLDQDGDDARSSAIERLDEPLIVAALNHAPLFSSRRYGALTLQSYKAAVRKQSGSRDGTDTSAVDRVLSDECGGSPELVARIRGETDQLARSLAGIPIAFSRHASRIGPKLTRIGDAVGQLQALFERVQPTASPSGTGGAGSGDVETAGEGPQDAQAFEGARGGIGTSRQASAALDAAIGYLSDAEPSSPALLLMRQAQALVGKPFLDAMRALFPEQVRHAGVTVAAPSIFRLPLTQLVENSPPPEGERDAAEAGAEGPPVPAPRSRADALLLIEAVAAYYRTAEPSSPIPMLLDRARPLLGQDFMALVRSMLPARMLSDE